MKNMILAIIVLLLSSLGRAQSINVQKANDGTNALTGSLVVGSGKTLTATGTGTIVATSGSATSVPWSGVTGTPTTLTGYGITNTLTTTAPLTGGGSLASNLTFAIPAATSSVNGYLSSSDWMTFNSKTTLPSQTGNTGKFLTTDGTSVSWAPFSTTTWGGIGGTLSNQTDLQSALNGKQAAGSYLTALTGDATASGPGSAALTFATVNANVGTFAGITVNAKGLVTGASALTISTTAPLTGGGTLANLTLAIPAATTSANGYLTSTDWNTFNGKQAAGSYALQSTTVNGHALSSNVTVTNSDLGAVPTSTTVNGHALTGNVTVSASDVGLGSVENTALSTWAGSGNLTTTGTITSGTWHGIAVADGYVASSSIWNAKQAALSFGNLTEATSSVLTITGGTGAVIGSGTSLQVKQASTSQSGYLSSTDWNTFNGKQAALSLPLSPSNGGTVVSNSSTITLGGNLTTSGAYTTTLVTTGNTSVTLPTSGTLATTTGIVSSIAGTSGQITASASTGAVTLSIPTAVTNVNSITASASTNLTLAAGSGSQDIVLTPSAGNSVKMTGNFSQNLGLDVTTTAVIGGSSTLPASGRITNVRIGSPSSGSHIGTSLLSLERAGGALWQMGISSASAGASTSINDLQFIDASGDCQVAINVDGTIRSVAGAVLGGGLSATSIQGTPIGSTTPSTGAFTTISATGAISSSTTISATGAISSSATGAFSSGIINTNSVTAAASNNLALTAGSGNQNVVLSPSGTGYVLSAGALTSTGLFTVSHTGDEVIRCIGAGAYISFYNVANTVASGTLQIGDDGVGSFSSNLLGGVLDMNVHGNTIGEFSATGLAITGTLSATSNLVLTNSTLSQNQGLDVTTTTILGGSSSSPSTNRVTNVRIGTPSNGTHIGTALVSFERASTAGWQIGLSNGAYNAATSVYDLQFFNSTGDCTVAFAGDGTIRSQSDIYAGGKYHAPLSTPANSSATGTAGTICWDANYIYVWTATNTVKRAALLTF